MTDPTVKLLADRLARRAIFDKSGGTISAIFAQDPLADLIEQAITTYAQERGTVRPQEPEGADGVSRASAGQAAQPKPAPSGFYNDWLAQLLVKALLGIENPTLAPTEWASGCAKISRDIRRQLDGPFGRLARSIRTDISREAQSAYADLRSLIRLDSPWDGVE